jgi:hypothetical protein
METYSLRLYEPETGKFRVVQMTYDQIIENPFRLNSNDIVYVLLNKLRKEKGLDPLPGNSIPENGEQNG